MKKYDRMFWGYKRRLLGDEQMEVVFNSMNDCLMVLSLDNEILFCNESLLKKLKYTREELKNKNIEQFTRDKNIFNEKKEIILVDGENNNIKFTYNIAKNKWKNIECIFLILTEKKDNNCNKEMLEAILDKIPIMACIKDLNGKYIYANDSSLKKLNCTTKDIIGKTAEDFLSGENLQNTLSDDRSLCLNKNKSFREMQIWFNGRSIWFNIAKNVLLDNNGDVKYIFSVAEEITEEKRNEERREFLEKEREAEILRYEFFNNISHEFKTPLNVVLSTTQLLNTYIYNNDLHKINEEKLKNYISIINNSSYRLLRLVNNLIDMTEIDTGHCELLLENLNIVSIVENIVYCVSEYVEKIGGAITFDTFEEERIIGCDIEKIERIILNLLSNAIKFSEDNLKILVSVNSSDDEVSISIKDNGIGIPSDKINNIFDVFVQEDKSLSRKQEGSGVGLALVKSLVEMHEGTIEVKSELGQGSEFIVKLPVKLVEDNETNIVDRKKVPEGEKCKIEFSDIYFV